MYILQHSDEEVNDPVNGKGSGPLGTYAVKWNRLLHNVRALRLVTGEAMARPGQVQVSVDMQNGEPGIVKTGDHAVIAFPAEIEL